MPPPPPPSKSYLLVFDDSDLDSDSDNENGRSSSSTTAAPYFATDVQRIEPSLPIATMVPKSDAAPLVVAAAEIAPPMKNSSSSSSNSYSSGTGKASALVDSLMSAMFSTLSSPSPSPAPTEISMTASEENYEDAMCVVVSPPVAQEFSSNNNEDADGDVEDEEDDEELVDLAKMTTGSGGQQAPNKRKRKKKKGKKKKTKSSSASTTAAAAKEQVDAVVTVVTPIKAKKSVRFGNVKVTEFSRCLGMCVVPGDGGWPLGLSNEVAPATQDPPATAAVAAMEDESQPKEAPALTVDSYEASKEEKLRIRWQSMQQQQHQHQQHSKNDPDASQPQEPPKVLETRQWDYRSRCHKNPLFGPLSEKERMRLLLADSGTFLPDENSHNKKKKKKKNNDHSPEHNNKQQQHHSSNQKQHNTRRSSGGAGGNGSGQFAGISGDVYNEIYTRNDVIRVRNDLEQIRSARSVEGYAGCTCRKLSVKLPQEGGTKKSTRSRMSLPDVKKELRKRHLMPSEDVFMTREELEQLLHDAVEEEPCCGDDCECSRAGIGCQADTCSCWYMSHQSVDCKGGKSKSSANAAEDKMATVAQIQERCSNKFGMYTVDCDRIDEYRAAFLGTKQFFCQPAMTTTTSTEMASTSTPLPVAIEL